VARKGDPDLMRTLRGTGLRKKIARSLAETAETSNPKKDPELVARAVESLRTAASELERRVTRSSQSEAAQKAARTRKRNAAQRRASARKAAKTRSTAA
jgi:hypothetical protein